MRLTETGGSTAVAVDANGAAGGSAFTDLALLQGVTGLDLNTLITNGNIDTAV